MDAAEQVAPAPQSRVAPEATQPRPRRRRPASAWVLMALAFVVAALAVYAALRDTSPYHVAAIAARDLPAGALLSPDPVSFTELRVADEVAATLLTREHINSREGWIVSQPIQAEALVALDALRTPSAPEELRAVSLPVPAERAVAGSIQRGDRVDIIEVRDDAAVYPGRQGIHTAALAHAVAGLPHRRRLPARDRRRGSLAPTRPAGVRLHRAPLRRGRP